MTLAAIAKTLAKELSTSDQNVAQVMRLLDSGLKAPTIAHFRRAEIGALTEGAIRRIERRRRQLEELDRRRRSLLRSVAKEIRAAQRADAEAARTEAEAQAPAAEAPAAEAPAAGAAATEAPAGEQPAAPDAEAPSAGAEPASEAQASGEPSGEAAGEAEESESDDPAAGADATRSEPEAPLDPVEEFSEVSPSLVLAAFRCTERSELEDLFLPLRRPEPEVQLAVDRGLAQLAASLVKPGPKQAEPAEAQASEGAEASDVSASSEPAPSGEASSEAATTTPAPEASSADQAAEPSGSDASDEQAPATEQQNPEQQDPEQQDPLQQDPLQQGSEERGAEGAPVEGQADEPQPGAAQAPDAAGSTAGGAEGDPKADAAPRPSKGAAAPEAPRQVEFNPELARMCAPFVNTDRGVHTEEEALEGAMRILSDRLGRDPKVRGMVRKLVRKQGRLSVRALVEEKQLGRNRSLLKLRQPARQVQGHKLISLRQALMRRQVSVHVELDPKLALPKLVSTLGQRLPEERRGVAEVVAERALQRRLLPMIEEDLRAEIRERAEEEAIRSIAQNLRQTLLAPAGGRRPCAGVHIDAKGDWTIQALDEEGAPTGEAVKLEAGSKELPELAEPLREALSTHGVRVLAVSSEKGAKAGVRKLREVVHLLGAQAAVVPVNDAGLGGWANGEAARNELGELSVPVRTAVGLGRRWQDPLRELVRVEARQLGLGVEQGIVGRGALRRLIGDTLESCVAYAGCELNTSPLHLLRHVPGLDFEIAQKIVQRRAERPFTTTRELVDEGLLDEARHQNAAGFLRISDAPDPLERARMHPEQGDLARAIAEQLSVSVDELVGNRDLLRSLKRTGFDVEEYTWRDLTRGLGSPERDPRPRALIPRMLPPDTAPESLAKDQVVEGVVSSVASFGAFVDLGLTKDGMIHISEASQRYVRDARAMLAVGQVVRARVTNPESQRIELSLKGVPDPRKSGGGGGRRGDQQGGRGRGRHDKDLWPEYKPVVRAARSRRDGLAGAGAGGGGRGRGGQGGRGFGGRGRGPRRNQDEGFDRDAIRRAASEKVSYNPFANFFQKNKDGEGDEDS